jgi:hypothetical protein
MKINSLANFSEDLQESINKRNEENRIKKFRASPLYREYRDRQNTMARARRKERIENDK